MEFFEVIKKRRSIRRFKPIDIPEEKIKFICEAINLAPSAGNLQAFEVFIVKDKGKLKQISKAAFDQDFIAEAPIAFVFCANPDRSAVRYGLRGRKLYCIQDATIACTYAHLSATALGLGSVWVGAFNEREVLKIIGASENLIPVAILPIGFPDEEPEPTPRRRIEDLFHGL
ncbi:Nitroreductase [Candidatus Thermokryptus mobilis]|uniref:Nitroreductase n=1 Tax=Candidatus Thermokryptus mobilis TaxID=1643428 RepID=A0A0S4N2Z9_9BACT|nr:nitroreductase family protein [Candidatus Thermokryptus mobilis]CUU05452.1 Nitroreductase [Candidatus Thermokryptus mobilis]